MAAKLLIEAVTRRGCRKLLLISVRSTREYPLFITAATAVVAATAGATASAAATAAATASVAVVAAATTAITAAAADVSVVATVAANRRRRHTL